VSVVFERKIVVGIEDIIAISLDCNKCHRRITFGPDQRIAIPHACVCGQEWTWNSTPAFHSDESAFGICLHTIEVIRDLVRKKVGGFRILLEYKEE
jgi:hypothetical protein